LNLIYPLLLVGILAPQAHAKDNDKVNSAKKQKLAPLSEEFLLFLADMEDVEGELMHPVDVAVSETEKDKVKVEKQQLDKQVVGKRDEDIE